MSNQWQTVASFWVVTFHWCKKWTRSTLNDKRTWLEGSKAKHLNSTECQNSISTPVSAASLYILILELCPHLFFSKVTHAFLVLCYMSNYLTFILSFFFIIHSSNAAVKIELIFSQAFKGYLSWYSLSALSRRFCIFLWIKRTKNLYLFHWWKDNFKSN